MINNINGWKEMHCHDFKSVDATFPQEQRLIIIERNFPEAAVILTSD